jgi:AraC-like DNA-binding protein
MLLFLSLSGILLSSILLYFNARTYRSSLYLGLFFLTISLYGLVQYILLYSKSVFLCSLAEVHFSTLFFLPGPLLYWYIRSVITDNPSFRRSDIWHLIPMMVYFISALPYIFSPYSYKLDVAKAIVDDPGFLGTFNHTILSEIFSNTAVFVSRPLLLFLYTSWSIVIFIRHLMQKQDSSAIESISFMSRWLSFFLGFQILLLTAYLVIMLRTFVGEASDLFYTVNILQVFSAVGLIGILTAPFFFPAILYGLPRYPEANQIRLAESDSTGCRPENAETIHQSLNSEYIEFIVQTIDSYMQNLQPYCQPDFNMGSFSELTNIPVHHLSIYLNSVIGLSFSEFRNFHRVKHAKKMILDGKLGEMTIEAIGFCSGFSNRSTFYRVFKSAEGVTPGDFAAKTSEMDN